MLQKKVCVLGAFGVGKTSLVRRYVESIFSDTYLTTVGVKVDKKTLDVGGAPLTLVLWDIAGEDDTTAIRMSYLRGAAGYFLVADGTRPETVEVARFIQARVTAEVGPLPYLLLLNKADLVADLGALGIGRRRARGRRRGHPHERQDGRGGRRGVSATWLSASFGERCWIYRAEFPIGSCTSSRRSAPLRTS